MLYESYQKKIRKIAKALSAAVKLTPIVLATIAGISVITIALMAAKGTVGSVSCPSEVAYGEKIECSAGAFLSSVGYEFREINESWSEEIPRQQGEYEVRAKGYDIFGQPRYSDAKTFKINPIPIEVYASVESVVYGDSIATFGDLQYGDQVICDYLYEDDTAVQTKVTPTNVKILDNKGADVTDCYILTPITKEISVLPRPIGIVVEDYKTVYNGKEVSFNKYEVANGTLKDGDVLYATFPMSAIDVGSFDNTATFKVLNDNGAEVSHLYEIDITNGKLTIEKRPLIINTASMEETYNGSEFSCRQYTTDDSTALADGHSLIVKEFSAFVDAGEYKNAMIFEIVDGNGKSVTENYSLTVIEGTITIAKRPITVTTPTESWVYDGQYHSNVLFSVDGAVNGHNVEVLSSYESIRNVGEIKNEFAVHVTDARGIDVTDNYDISYTFGTLSVTKRPLSITTGSDRLTYSGNYFYVDKVLVDGLASGEHLASENVVSGYKDAGEYENGLGEIRILDTSGSNQVDNYSITYNYGTVVIDRRPVTIKPMDVSRVYDGTPLVPSDIEAVSYSPYQIVSWHRVDVDFSGERLDVGSQITKITSARIFDGDEDVTANYDLSFENGRVTVDVRKVVIKAADNSWMYDGYSHTHTEYLLLSEYDIADVETLVIDSSSSVTEVTEGTVENVFYEYRILDANGNNKIRNYDLTVYNGSIWIVPRNISLTIEDTEWKYDDQEHSNVDYIIGGSGLADGQFIKIIDNATITDVGEIPNFISIKIVKENPDAFENPDKTLNYVIEENFGILRINPRVLKLQIEDKKWTYDGQEHFCIDYINLGDEPVEGHYIKINDYARITDVGLIQNYLDISVIKRNPKLGENRDKTSNYVVDTSLIGTLEVIEKDVTIATGSLTVTYDGTTYTCPDFDIKGDGFVDGHRFEVYDSTAVEDYTPEPVKNEFYIFDVLDLNGDSKKHNYNIIFEYGTLTVNKRDLTVITEDMTWQYDGLTHSYIVDEYGNSTVTVIGLADGQSVRFDEIASVTDAEKIENSVKVSVIKDYPSPYEEADKTHNYNISYTFGELEVTKRYITVITGTMSKIYNGMPQSCTEFVIKGDGIAPAQLFKVISSTAVEDYTPEPVKNEFFEIEIVDMLGIDRAYNYVIEYEHGTITITKKMLIINTKDYTWEYDGFEHSYIVDDNGQSTVVYNSLAEGQSFQISDYAKITDVGTTQNSIEGIVVKNNPAEGEDPDKTHNYNIRYKFGTLEVIKRRLVITTESNFDTVYDGTAHRFEKFYVTEGSFAPNQKLEIYESTSLTYVTDGIQDNEFTKYAIVDVNGVNQCENYDLTILCGKIGIAKRTVYIETLGASKVFDGLPLRNKGYKLADSSPYDFVSEEIFNVIISTSITYYTEGEDGKVINEFIYTEVIDAKGVNRQDNYSIEYTGNGILQILQRPLTVYSKGAEKYYDGTALKNPACGLLDGSLVAGHSLWIEATGEQLLPGESLNTVSYEITDQNGAVMTENYVITEVLEKLRVNAISITVYMSRLSKQYDGSVLAFGENDYLVVSGEGVEVTDVSLNLSLVNVGKISVDMLNGNPEKYISFKATCIVDGVIQDITEGCIVVFVAVNPNYNDVLEITPRTITLTANSVTVEYDEENPMLYAESDGFSVTLGTLVSGHTVEAIVDGIVFGNPDTISTGSSEILEDSVKIFDENGDDVTENYVVTRVSGILTILPEEN